MSSDRDQIVLEAITFAENAATAAAQLQRAFSSPDLDQRAMGAAAEAFRLASLNSSDLFASCRAYLLTAPGPSSAHQASLPPEPEVEPEAAPEPETEPQTEPQTEASQPGYQAPPPPEPDPFGW